MIYRIEAWLSLAGDRVLAGEMVCEVESDGRGRGAFALDPDGFCCHGGCEERSDEQEERRLTGYHAAESTPLPERPATGFGRGKRRRVSFPDPRRAQDPKASERK